MQVAFLNGIHIHYKRQDRPAAPVVVFVNSLGSDLRIWERVVEGLGDTVQSICYDKRGHGLSDAPAPPYTMNDHVNDLEAVLASLEVKRALICGISVGGMIALGLSAAKPELVRGLVLCDTAHRIGSDDLWNQRIAQVEQHGMGSIADGVIERWFTEGFRRTRTREVAGWRNMLLRTPAAGYAGTCAALRDADLTGAARGVACPTQCLCGAEDLATPPALVQSMAELIPAARYRSIDGAGHLPCIEAPGKIVAAITETLERSAS
ncbi:MAG: 3-oxoadipate enol-lactonase [Desulfosarcinaceae bacterium]